jgi:ribonuclease VapC
VGAARRQVDRFLRLAGVRIVEIGDDELARALDAFDRYGKGRHPARLNMGDCFAYACAKTQGVPLLFKGDDFGQTDIAIA